MNANDSFVDLRLNQQDNPNESFWPSFTDIMTVVVMIFLLAMVILLIRNMELVRQLRATMEAERVAAELARSTGAQNQDLALRLHSVESELSQARMQIMRMEEQREEQDAALVSHLDQINRLTQERDQLSVQANDLTNQTAQLTDKLSTAERLAAGLQQDYDRLRERNDETLAKLQEQLQSRADQERALELSQSQLRQYAEQLTSLRDEHAGLLVKYNELIKPARSAEGKFVVEVRYSKQGGQPVYEFREAAQPRFESLSESALHQRLDVAKQAYPAALYVKVIIPESSGLTYNEAYRFTTALHQKYDYYFREPPAKPPVESESDAESAVTAPTASDNADPATEVPATPASEAPAQTESAQ